MEKRTRATSKKDQQLASSSLSKLSQHHDKDRQGGVQIRVQETGELVNIPQKALDLLIDVLSNMAEGKSVSIIPTNSEITTQQAADILHVSRPHIIKLLNQGTIPFRKVGNHRRILLKDLVRYQNQLKKQRRQQLNNLAEQAQDLDLGYE